MCSHPTSWSLLEFADIFFCHPLIRSCSSMHYGKSCKNSKIRKQAELLETALHSVLGDIFNTTPTPFFISVFLSFLPSFALFFSITVNLPDIFSFHPSLFPSLTQSAPPAKLRNSLSWILGRKLYDMPVRNVNIKWSVKIFPGANLNFWFSLFPWTRLN